MAENTRKYNSMEKVLGVIHKNFISLPKRSTKINNQYLRVFLNVLTTKMKKNDSLFRELYTAPYFAGSFYDGLKVAKPDEFDIDLLLHLPKLAKPILRQSNIPGYVDVEITNSTNSIKGLDKLLDDKKYLDTLEVRKWFQSLLDVTLNEYPKENGQVVWKTKKITFYLKVRQSGPAFTLKYETKNLTHNFNFDIDLVPSFEFSEEDLPELYSKLKPEKSKRNFFIVPKPIKYAVSGKEDRYWRLSFQEEEKKIIHHQRYLKPAVRLLKKLRDVLDHKYIASYYLKTLALLVLDKEERAFWDYSMSYTFVTMLKTYYEYLEKGKIPYYWYSNKNKDNNNLLQRLSADTIQNTANKIKQIIDDIERNLPHNPAVLAKYLLTSNELEQFATIMNQKK